MARSELAMERDREEWRKRARAAMKALGRGAQARCARELRTSEAEVSHLLSGRIKFSHWVVPISEWLGIAPPTIGMPDAVAELISVATTLTPEDRDALLNMAKHLKDRSEKH